MQQRKNLHIQKLEGGMASGSDHFRHTLGFIQSLHQALSHPTNPVNYDKRERFSIDENTLPDYIGEAEHMISELTLQNPKKEIIITSTVYSDMEVSSTLGRELALVFDHESLHRRYFTSQNKTPTFMPIVQSIDQTKKPLYIHPLLREHIEATFTLMHTLHQNQNMLLPGYMQEEMNMIKHFSQFLETQKTDNTVTFHNGLVSSISNEYYKMSESLIHLLYEMRLWMHKHNSQYYQEITAKYPNIGIGYATLQAKK